MKEVALFPASPIQLVFQDNPMVLVDKIKFFTEKFQSGNVEEMIEFYNWFFAFFTEILIWAMITNELNQRYTVTDGDSDKELGCHQWNPLINVNILIDDDDW